MMTKREAAALGTAAYRAGAAARNRDLIADVEWILSADDPATAARRLGYDRPASLARRLARAGRGDLARTFWRVDGDQRRRAANVPTREATAA